MTIRFPHASSQPEAAAHLLIYGRVQGVGFRDAFSLQALERGLDGWVRNRRDGSVEALIRWAHHGPPAARVERLEKRPARSDEAAAVQAGFLRLPSA